jgi:hypothetical protein
VVGAKPASTPTASAASKPAAVAGGTAYGAKSVPSAQRFTLRMSGPIKSLQGSSDRTGFTVVIPGVRSLDKAGPIAASHKGVAKAMVLNRGDYAELSIRFADGKSPAFRVAARGAELDVLLAP